MGILKDQRHKLGLILEEVNFPTVYEYVPERTHAPCAMVVFGSPFLESGEVFGTSRLRYEIDVIPQTGSNEAVTNELEDFVEALLPLLSDADYDIVQVGQPRIRNANNASYLVATITVTTDVVL